MYTRIFSENPSEIPKLLYYVTDKKYLKKIFAEGLFLWPKKRKLHESDKAAYKEFDGLDEDARVLRIKTSELNKGLFVTESSYEGSLLYQGRIPKRNITIVKGFKERAPSKRQELFKQQFLQNLGDQNKDYFQSYIYTTDTEEVVRFLQSIDALFPDLLGHFKNLDYVVEDGKTKITGRYLTDEEV